MALPKEKLRKPRVGRARVKDLTTLVLANFEAMLALAEQTFKEAKLTQIQEAYDHLERRSNVFYAAALDAWSPWTAEQKKRHLALN